ncbi:hypothetical protein GCM10020358_06860 [Amorphoplanes nipponensis]|uniref:Uncharacterized protein n=1 Tax=Actinoplanes nipponensis TaxID=135950 RepID=A0A919JG42_9ACTN|nr:hypothetical protein [Actinoplanes nipponensis]GIE50128.1 hypothetical protein Ani05nite_36620 [Actinoplanes nipponensis]
MPASTEDLIRALYEAPPEGFVAGRAAAVAEAKRAGDQETARRLAALRKPTVAAWLVNLLALRRPELIDELVELSTALRSAQRGLQGDQLRELSSQRRQVVSALVHAAQQLAVEDDPGLRTVKLPMAEVEATLTAALAEPDIAEQVRSGRLVKAATYAGFGEVPRPRLRLVTAGEPDEEEDEAGGEAEEMPPNPFAVAARPSALEDRKRRAAEKARQERAERRRELKRRLTTARAAEAKTRTRLERAEAAEHEAAGAVDEIEEQLAELERRRIVAQAEVSRRKLARRAAERDASAARREVGDVDAALEDLDADEPDK